MCANLREDLRLVLLHPQQLGQREIRQRRIAGQLDQPVIANLLASASRIPAASACRTRSATAAAPLRSHPASRRHASAPSARWPQSALAAPARRPAPADRFLRRTPPVLRILLRPSRVRRAEGACSLDAPLISLPVASTTTARVPPVPTSMPRNHIARIIPLVNRFSLRPQHTSFSHFAEWLPYLVTSLELYSALHA